jgi:acyl-CoA synthetase (NDP forming)
LLSPKAIAVVGASPNERSIPGRLIATICASRNVTVYPVNPKYDMVLGCRCYPDLQALPHIPDLAALVIPSGRLTGTLYDAATLGIPFAIVFSSVPHSESVKKPNGIRVVGPNSQGYMDVLSGLRVSFSPVMAVSDADVRAERTGAVIIAQSGSLGFALLPNLARRRVPIRSIVTTGSELDLEVTDFIRHYGHAGAGTIGIILEGLRDLDRFLVAADEAVSHGTNLVALRIGRTAIGRKAALSHTGQIITDAGLYSAALAKVGVAEAHDLEEFADLVAVAPSRARRAGKSFAIFGASGGAGILLADQLVDAGLDVPQLRASTQRALTSQLPRFASVANPIDVTPQASADGSLATALSTLASSPDVDAVMLVGSFGYSQAVVGDQPAMSVLAQFSKPTLAYSYTPVSMQAADAFEAAGIPWFESAQRAATSAQRLLSWPVNRHISARRRTLTIDSDQPGSLRAAFVAEGIPFPPGAMVRDLDEAAAVAKRVGFPLVVKILPRRPVHKARVGGVVTGIQDEAQAAAAYIAVTEAAARAKLSIDGVWLERQIDGQELILGASNQLQSGPLILLGKGGTEAVRSRAHVFGFGLLSDREALDLVAALQRFPEMQPELGSMSGGSIRSLRDLIVRFSRFARRLKGSWRAIELNPIILTADTAIAVDARIVNVDIEKEV